MRKLWKILVLAGLLSLGLNAAGNRFVHTDGTHVVGPDGHKLLLRGINLGNWLVPEGYMWHFDKGPASYREISAVLNDLVGPAEAARFWKQYRDNYITEADIRFIHEAGFNSVRVPFHYQLIADGTAFPARPVDRVVPAGAPLGDSGYALRPRRTDGNEPSRRKSLLRINGFIPSRRPKSSVTKLKKMVR